MSQINLYVLAAWYIAFGLLSFAFSLATAFAIRSFRARPGSLTYNADARFFGRRFRFELEDLCRNTEFCGRSRDDRMHGKFLVETYNLSGSTSCYS